MLTSLNRAHCDENSLNQIKYAIQFERFSRRSPPIAIVNSIILLNVSDFEHFETVDNVNGIIILFIKPSFFVPLCLYKLKNRSMLAALALSPSKVVWQKKTQREKKPTKKLINKRQIHCFHFAHVSSPLHFIYYAQSFAGSFRWEVCCYLKN